MAYLSIYVKDANELRVHNNQLQFKKDNITNTIPLEDVSIILIENQDTMISSFLIGQLSFYNVCLIFCDVKHNPSTITMPLNSHYKQLKVFKTQMDIKKPVLSQCWQMIIKQKIYNQMLNLKYHDKNEYGISKLKDYYDEVKSNDNTNREAVAAKMYFDCLFGSQFRRDRNNEDPINCALNYAYTVFTAAMVRILTTYGFNTVLGIHHSSMFNNFNLACDLVEPFRQVVDYYITKNINEINYPLTSNNKKDLIDLLHFNVRMNNCIYTVENAMEEVTISLIKVYENNDSSFLLLPEIIDKEFNKQNENEDEL